MWSCLGLHHFFTNGPSLTRLCANPCLGALGFLDDAGREKTELFLGRELWKRNSIFEYLLFGEMSSLFRAANLYICSY